MLRPTSAAQRPDLQAVVFGAADQPSGYIGLNVLPIFNVPEVTGQYPVIPNDVMFSVPETRRTDRGGYHRSDWTWGWDTFKCVENGREEKIDDREVALYKRYFDAEVMATRRALNIVLRKQEKRIADEVFNASNFDVHEVTHEWDDPTNAVPITNVKTGRKAIHDAIGMEPNTLIISYSTFLDLGLCDQIIDRIKYTTPAVQRGDINAALLAQAFGVEQILVGGSLYNEAKKGQTPSLSALWSNEYAMLCVTSGSPMLSELPHLGRTFLWPGDSPSNTVVESYRDETVRADIVRVRHDTDEEFISTDCAYLLGNITTI